MEDPVFDISVCAQHTQHVHDIIHLLAGLLPHPATVSGPLVTPLLYCKPTAEIIGTVCHKKCHVLENSTTWCWKGWKGLSGFKDSGCYLFCRNFVGSKTLPALELPGKGGGGGSRDLPKMGRFGKLGGWTSTKLCDFVSFPLNEMFFFLVGGLLQVCLFCLQVLFWLEFWTKWNRTSTWLNATDPHRIPPKTSGFLSARPLSLKRFRRVWCLVGMGIDGMYSPL